MSERERACAGDAPPPEGTNAEDHRDAATERGHAGLSRRRLLRYGALSTVGLGIHTAGVGGQTGTESSRPQTHGRLRQSACRWCYASVPLDELADAAVELGLRSVELLDPADFDTVVDRGLSCAMVNSHAIERGLNDPAHHDECLTSIRAAIDAAADAGFPNVITFAGNRRGRSDEDGLTNCERALRAILPHAERRGVTICMELLNSRVDHPDYMADRTPWGVELVRRVGSDRFRLLFDIYHMQIMEGDVIRTIREHHAAIGHYHTAGNPGRHDLDEEQELFYPAIVRAIVDTGYDGFLGQEFIPRDRERWRESLAHGVRVCTV